MKSTFKNVILTFKFNWSIHLNILSLEHKISTDECKFAILCNTYYFVWRRQHSGCDDVLLIFIIYYWYNTE